MSGKHTTRPTGLARLLPGSIRPATLRGAVRAAPATVTAVAERTRQDPLRSGLAAGALLVAVFLLVTSVWAVFGRGSGTNRTIMVDPSAPVLVVPAGKIGEVDGGFAAELPLASSAPGAAPSAGVPVVTGTPTTGAPTSGGSPKPSRGSLGTSAAGVPTPSLTSRPTNPTSSPRPSPTATRTTTAPAPSVVTARYQSGGSWDTGFIGSVQLTNTGRAPQSWRVTLTFDGRADVRISNAWNAELTRNGDSNLLTGGPLAAGATVTVGFEASKRTQRRVQPTSCTVNGRGCRIG